jgi:hypothetical protein
MLDKPLKLTKKWLINMLYKDRQNANFQQENVDIALMSYCIIIRENMQF